MLVVPGLLGVHHARAVLLNHQHQPQQHLHQLQLLLLLTQLLLVSPARSGAEDRAGGEASLSLPDDGDAGGGTLSACGVARTQEVGMKLLTSFSLFRATPAGSGQRWRHLAERGVDCPAALQRIRAGR